MDVTLFISPIASAIIAFVVGYVAMKNANNDKFAKLMSQNAEQTAMIASLKEQMVTLRNQVEKHNGVIERTYKLESDMSTVWKRIDELKDKDTKLEDKMERYRG